MFTGKWHVRDDRREFPDRDALAGDQGLTFWGIAPLVIGWAIVTVIAFVAADAVATRFFDLPLAAFLAGQGALVGAVALVGLSRRPGEAARRFR
ncbi:hypothetical protein [Rubrimonas cliftonensis]|uniref:Putative solute:sodium symporter small subunit n=1 Tax=Rubrimonas cliftonensis TaxID=89524 RepID=A0A1H4A6Q1_9RHOB|nr:hypothetical protein [Rubrimonas cliftonensis]SEA31607.1 putative solute:sodium symporter small subunit [Rubrimonas cliftonensis]